MKTALSFLWVVLAGISSYSILAETYPMSPAENAFESNSSGNLDARVSPATRAWGAGTKRRPTSSHPILHAWKMKWAEFKGLPMELSKITQVIRMQVHHVADSQRTTYVLTLRMEENRFGGKATTFYAVYDNNGEVQRIMVETRKHFPSIERAMLSATDIQALENTLIQVREKEMNEIEQID